VSESSTSSQQDQDCIVMPIWKDTSYFGDAAPRTVVDAQIEDKDELHDKNDATEKSHDDSSLKDNGTAIQQVNTARPEINTGSREVSTVVPEVNTATPEDLVGPSHASEDTQVEGQEVELGNIPQSYAEEPKRVSKALSDPAWVEAMQEELLQFKLQKIQEEMKEVVKEAGAKRKKSIPRKSTRKRQKLEEDAEKEELKGFLDIIPREEVPMEVESLSTKFPIVDWKTCILTENFMYY
ncbi:hypothetical protein Tco_0829419, partial [Tanacetum coccineum]